MPVNLLPTVYALQLTGVLANEPYLSMNGFSGGRIINDSGAAVVLTVYESIAFNGTYVICKDVGTAGTFASLANGNSIALPTEMFGCYFVKFLAADTSGPTIHVVLK